MSRNDECPSCGSSPVTVSDSRATPLGRRRRRYCRGCGRTWATIEIALDPEGRVSLIAPLLRALRSAEAITADLRPVLAAIEQQDADDAPEPSA